MNERYIEQIKLLTCQCDRYGGWLPSAILDAMQESAGRHCEVLGLGKKQMDELGLAWVLSRVKVQMNKQPQYGDSLSVETYPTACRHLFYPRSNVFRDENGEEIGYANSLWMLMDKNSRKVVQSTEVQKHMPDLSTLRSRIGLPSTVSALDGEVQKRSITPRFTDFDLQQHVNNTKYLDFCCDALGHDVMEQYWIHSFNVNYESEILPGEEIRTELVRSGREFVFFGYVGMQRHFAIDGQLELRDAP